MNKYELPCEIVEDLLPGYIDGLTNEATTESVKSHLETCQDCREKYENMTGQEPEQVVTEEAARVKHEEKAEIDFLKKSRKKHRKSLLLSILAAVVIMLGIIAVKVYLIGSVCSAELVECNVREDDGDFIFWFYASPYWYDITCVHYAESDGLLDITLKTAPRTPFYQNNITGNYTPTGDITEIRLNGDVIWADGERIEAEINSIYEARIPYIGDASRAINLASELGVASLVGPFKNEMFTSEEPYGWTITPDNAINPDGTDIEEQMQAYAAVLIALVDNLGEMNFEYHTTSGETRTVSVDTATASEMVGENIKNAVGSVGELKKLLKKLNMYRLNIYSTDSARNFVADNLAIHVINRTEDEIYGIGVYLYLDGEILTGIYANNADESALSEDDIKDFVFTPEESGIHIQEKYEVSIGVEALNSNSDILGEACIEIDPYDPEYYDGATYTRTLVLTGNAVDGYSVE